MKKLTKLLKEIDKIEKETSVKNWNGYDAEPIPKESFKYIKEFLRLLDLFSKSLPLPETSPISGRMGLELDMEDNNLLVSIDKKGILYWTALMGKEERQGKINFKSFINLIETIERFE